MFKWPKHTLNETAESDTGAGSGETGDAGGGVMSQAGAWEWAEGVPGEGDRPEWLSDKFKTVSDLGVAYGELEAKQGKYGSYFGAPEGDYELTLPEGVSGEFDADNPLLKAVTGVAKEIGLSQDGFTRLLHEYVNNDAALITSQAVNAQQVAQELGENGQQILTDTWARLNQVLGPDDAAALDSVTTSAAAVQAIGKLLGSEAVLPSDTGEAVGQITRAELDAMLFEKFPEGHPQAGQRKYLHDADHKKKVDAAFEARYPGRDIQEV